MSLSSDLLCLPTHRDHFDADDLDGHTLGRKRRRDCVDDEDGVYHLDAGPFAIESTAVGHDQKPHVYTPICLLQREQLPLSYLNADSTGSLLFQAHVEALDDRDGQSTNGSRLLILRNEFENMLYAVERVRHRTYALCKLADWVRPGDVLARARSMRAHTKPRSKRRALESIPGNEMPWWLAVASATNGQDLEILASEPALSVAMSGRLKSFSRNISCLGVSVLDSTESSVDPQIKEDRNPNSHLDAMQELAKHYLLALYTSRTSLAYFVKGPLSRARAAFTAQASPEWEAPTLVDFLRQALLPSNVIDQKFRQAIPDHIRGLATLSNATSEQRAKSRKKRKWKAKRDKAGFFAGEKEYVEQWWQSSIEADPAPPPCSMDEAEAGMKQRTLWLQIRETYMQIILILEIRAIETTMSREMLWRQNQGSGAFRGEPSDSWHADSRTDIHIAEENKAQKPKSPRDLKSLLETLLDKLCIWHSVHGNSPSKNAQGGNSKVSAEAGDVLKSFCVEVVVPFYTSRAPMEAILANKKLGGPRVPSAAVGKSASKKPGERNLRPLPVKEPRGYTHRVWSDTSRTTQIPVATLQSDSRLDLDVKRDPSAMPSPSLKSSDLVWFRKRPSLMQHLAKREVDLSAVAQATEAKMLKKAEVEGKLREAISAIRGPNRSAATKDVAESTDTRFTRATERKRSTQIARRERPVADLVTSDAELHVTASPAHPYAVKGTPSKKPAGILGPRFTSSSGAHVTACSAQRLNAPTTETGPRNFNAVDGRQTNVKGTPMVKTRTCGQQIPTASSPAFEPPAPNDGSSMFEVSPCVTPCRHSAVTHGAISPSLSHIEQTAIPASTLRSSTTFDLTRSPTAERTLELLLPNEPSEMKSIYDVLGWND